MDSFLTSPVFNPALEGVPPAPENTVTERGETVVSPRTRILYADDEPQLRTLGKLMLVLSGYDVDTAEDGVQAWEALNEASYNLLITDHDMPRLTGMDLVARVRRAGMRLPIVMTSGSLNLLHDLASSGSDLAAFLPKPFASHTLVETVEQALREANCAPQSGGATISAFERIIRSAQPYLHGGINE